MSDCGPSKARRVRLLILKRTLVARQGGEMQHQQQDGIIESATELQVTHYTNTASSSSVKVMEEIGLVYRMLRGKIEDESFVNFLANEITALALVPNSDDSILNISSKDGLDQSDIPPLINVMKGYASNEFVQRDCLRELQRLAGRGDEYGVAVAREGAIELIIQAMTKFPKNSALQRYGCLAFGNLSFNNQANSEEIGSRGGVSLAIRALTIFQEGDLAVHQRDICYALGNLAVQDENRSRIARQGGIKFMIQSMKKFVHDSLFQRYGCALLGNLALEQDSEIEIARQGGIQLIIQAISKYNNIDELQLYGIFALGNMSLTMDHAVIIAENGGIISILKTMRKFPGNEKIQENGSLVLANMSSRVDYDHHVVIRKNGGLKLAVSAIQRFPSNNWLQRCCFCVLGNLASKELPKHARICVSLAMDTLLESSREEEEEGGGGGDRARRGMLPFACYSLEAWAVACPECQPYIVSLGGVDVAREVWKADLDEVVRDAFLTGLSSLPDRFIFDHEFLSGCD